MIQSRITNVILTTEGDRQTYFTLEGVMIGGFDGGSRVAPKEEVPINLKPDGGVVKSPTPHDVQRDKDRRVESLKTPEGRLKHLKEDIV